MSRLTATEAQLTAFRAQLTADGARLTGAGARLTAFRAQPTADGARRTAFGARLTVRRRRGEVDFIKVLGTLILVLAVVGVGLYLIQKYYYKQPIQVLDDVLQCSTVGGLVGEGICLQDRRCEGRPGWTGVKTTVFCPEKKPYCCILPPNNRDLYFTSGSLVVNNGDIEHKLVAGERIQIKESDYLAFYYVPKTGSGAGPADKTCTLTVIGKDARFSPATINDCYRMGEGIIDDMVLLWDGNGADLLRNVTSAKGGSQPADGYTVTVTTTPLGAPGGGAPSTSEYPNSIRIAGK